MAINDSNIEKLRNRFVAALKWIGLSPLIDKESLEHLLIKCRLCRRNSDLVYLLTSSAAELKELNAKRCAANYSKLINTLNELDKCLKSTPIDELDNLCVALK